MSIIERGYVPAGWYPDDEGGQERLRWWDGEQWSNEVRPLVIDMVPDFVAQRPALTLVTPTFVAPEPAVATVQSVPSAEDFTRRLASAPERSTPASYPAPDAAQVVVQAAPGTPLTRRQLRQMLGGPLTTAPAQLDERR